MQHTEQCAETNNTKISENQSSENDSITEIDTRINTNNKEVVISDNDDDIVIEQSNTRKRRTTTNKKQKIKVYYHFTGMY